MNKIFELIYKSGPHGDACTSYNIKFLNEPTLKEFINYVLQNNKDEWGEFYVYYDDPNAPEYATIDELETHVTIDYKYGNIAKVFDGNRYNETVNSNIGFTDLVNSMLDRKLDINWKNNYANGGWSAMDYWIKIKND